MRIAVRVKVEMGALKAFANALRAGFANPNPGGPVGEMRVQWLKRYESFVRRRFTAFSRGGGEWPPLAVATLRAKLVGSQRRRKDKEGNYKRRTLTRTGGGMRTTLARGKDGKAVGFSGRESSILVDTGTLRNALQIGASGNYAAGIPNGVAFGFADAAHPAKDKAKSHPTIQQIAAWHNFGSGRNPRRTILAMPDKQTADGMQADMARAVERLMRQSRAASPEGVTP